MNQDINEVQGSGYKKRRRLSKDKQSSKSPKNYFNFQKKQDIHFITETSQIENTDKQEEPSVKNIKEIAEKRFKNFSSLSNWNKNKEITIFQFNHKIRR